MKNLLILILGVILGIIICYFLINPNTETETMTKPRGVISPETAKKMDKAFDSRHKLISDSIVKRPDNRSSWWSLKDMRNYLDYAENQAKDLNYTMDGVRVYLGAYPDSKEVGYTTMFMAPTGQKNKSGETNNLKGGEGSGDIPGGDPLNDGGQGIPPSANYPQQ